MVWNEAANVQKYQIQHSIRFECRVALLTGLGRLGETNDSDLDDGTLCGKN